MEDLSIKVVAEQQIKGVRELGLKDLVRFLEAVFQAAPLLIRKIIGNLPSRPRVK